ncbi:MAG: hypothetical protein QFB86_01310 [Patescibacteria group bacterium]|nr:hypothetical protein [Patescibacteria group bacterium]
MNLSKNFPELSEGQLRMLERYVQDREQHAIKEALTNSRKV